MSNEWYGMVWYEVGKECTGFNSKGIRRLIVLHLISQDCIESALGRNNMVYDLTG